MKYYVVQTGGGEPINGIEPDPEVSGTTGSEGRNARNVFPYCAG